MSKKFYFIEVQAIMNTTRRFVLEADDEDSAREEAISMMFEEIDPFDDIYMCPDVVMTGEEVSE